MEYTTNVEYMLYYFFFFKDMYWEAQTHVINFLIKKKTLSGKEHEFIDIASS